MRTFIVHVEADVKMTLDDHVIDVVDDEWRKSLYKLYTAEDIAEHVGRNCIARDMKLSDLDGWADQPDSNEWHEIPDWEATVREVH